MEQKKVVGIRNIVCKETKNKQKFYSIQATNMDKPFSWFTNGIKELEELADTLNTGDKLEVTFMDGTGDYYTIRNDGVKLIQKQAGNTSNSDSDMVRCNKYTNRTNLAIGMFNAVAPIQWNENHSKTFKELCTLIGIDL